MVTSLATDVILGRRYRLVRRIASGGMASVWDGLDGVGYVEDVFVEPAYRHRGLATALLHRCAADTRARGTRALTLVADADDTPQAMYAAMGFRHVATKRRYVRYRRPEC